MLCMRPCGGVVWLVLASASESSPRLMYAFFKRPQTTGTRCGTESNQASLLRVGEIVNTSSGMLPLIDMMTRLVKPC